MTIAVMSIPTSDATAKLLGQNLSVGQIATSRFVIQCLLLLPLWLWWRHQGVWLQGLKRRDWWLGSLIAISILFLFWGLMHLPLANNIAIFFVEPLILVLFSKIFLGETVTTKRWVAVTVGLVGALIVIRPNIEAYGWATLLPLLSATAYAGYLTLTRAFSNAPDPENWPEAANGLQKSVRLQLMISLTAAGLMLLFMSVGQNASLTLTEVDWPTLTQWGLLGLLGLLAAFAHVLIALAFTHASASVLAPLQYLEILGAVFFGWWLFQEWPDLLTFVGAAVIIGSGLYIALEKPHRDVIED
ncbi:MAG: DMT family transporter, partial [Hydrogenovibrio sp.]|uniref:DMT family transporter n=1 Tax=Hydrogenovibrio sp. TaxID=2065821 RepID=UPI0028706C59